VSEYFRCIQKFEDVQKCLGVVQESEVNLELEHSPEDMSIEVTIKLEFQK